MELKEQRYVVTLADTGNLTKAAKKLNISQPALSLYIKNLENSYGEQLFSRQNRRLKPTYFGELYIEKARQILRIGNDFKEEMDFMRNG
ncbi:MAG: LysR family transcriptional regulator, partial [Clostridiaceae bacterium]